MDQDIAILSFYSELADIYEYEEHEKVAFFGRLKQGLQSGKEALKTYSTSIKSGLKGTPENPMKVQSMANPLENVDLVIPQARQKGGLALSPDEMTTLRQAESIEKLDTPLQAKVRNVVGDEGKLTDLKFTQQTGDGLKQVGFDDVKITSGSMTEQTNIAKLESLDAAQAQTYKSRLDRVRQLENERATLDEFDDALEIGRINNNIASIKNDLKQTDALLETLGSADKMKTLKDDLRQERKFLQWSNKFEPVAVQNRLEQAGIPITEGMGEALRSNDMNKVLAQLDSMESTTRQAANQALASADNAKLTNVIGGELEQILRINPDANLSNLNPEQLRAIAQAKGLDAVADIVEPVVMGGAYGAAGLAGAAGLGMTGIFGE